MNIVEQLIQEINHLSNVYGPHWVMTEEIGATGVVSEGSGSTVQMLHMLLGRESEIDNGIYIKYPKGRFIHNEEPFTYDWSRITTETAIIKVVFPQLGNDTVWLLAPQHPFP